MLLIRLFKDIFKRNIVIFLLAAAVCGQLIDEEQVLVSRLNYLKSRFDVNWEDFSEKDSDLQKEHFGLASFYNKKLIQLMPNEALFYGVKGYHEFYLKNYDKAIAAYEYALAIHPSFYTFSLDLGMIYYSFGNYEEAAIYLKKSLESVLLMKMYFLQSFPQQQKVDGGSGSLVFKKVLNQIEIDQEVAIHFLAQCFLKQGKIDEMRSTLLVGIMHGEDAPRFSYDLGVLCFLEKNMEKSEYFLSQAIARDPQYLDAYIFRREVRKLLKDVSGMIQDDENVLRIQVSGVTQEEEIKLHKNSDFIFLNHPAY